MNSEEEALRFLSFFSSLYAQAREFRRSPRLKS
jgi:hypothetical protein